MTNWAPLSVCPDWLIYWTLGKFLKPFATINLPKSPTFLAIFVRVSKIYHFSIDIIFGQLLQTFGDFFLVTLSTLESIKTYIWVPRSFKIMQKLATEFWPFQAYFFGFLVVLALLAKQSLLTPEVCGSNPVIGKFLRTTVSKRRK